MVVNNAIHSVSYTNRFHVYWECTFRSLVQNSTYFRYHSIWISIIAIFSVAFNESVDGSIGSRRLAATVSGSSSYSQTSKKNKTMKRKQLNSVSGVSSSKVVF